MLEAALAKLDARAASDAAAQSMTLPAPYHHSDDHAWRAATRDISLAVQARLQRSSYGVGSPTATHSSVHEQSNINQSSPRWGDPGSPPPAMGVFASSPGAAGAAAMRELAKHTNTREISSVDCCRQ